MGGKFKTVMAAKDKSTSFDFTGTYTAVKENELIEYDMDDGRCVKVEFRDTANGVKITEIFEPEKINPEESSERASKLVSITLENMSKGSKYAYTQKTIQNDR